MQDACKFKLILAFLVVLLLDLFLAFSTPAPMKPLRRTASAIIPIIDSHLHVWAPPSESLKYPYVSPSGDLPPPPSLAEKASVTSLLQKMNDANVKGSLIVQPINYGFDHSYVSKCIENHPGRLKGMLLHDPSLNPKDGIKQLEELKKKGFVGVRFNPYLSPGKDMSDPTNNGGATLAVFKRCGSVDIRMPVGIMCFQGFEKHRDDIVKLIEHSPETPVIIDHFGFTTLGEDDNRGDNAFRDLLNVASRYPSVHVKISAPFRVTSNKNGGDKKSPYEDVKEKRFKQLLETIGAERLMFGTDFPFVLDEENICGYKETVELVMSWADNEKDRQAIMGGTAEKLFGAWG